MQTVHHFFDRSVPIPPVQVEDVDVRSAQFPEAGFDTEVHGLYTVACVDTLLLEIVLSTLVISCILERQIESCCVEDVVSNRFTFVEMTS